MSDIEVWYRGETTELVITAVFDGELRDLRDFTGGIELQVKRNLDDADPPIVALTVGDGITLRDQDTAEGLGYADAVIPSDAWGAEEAGYVWVDVVGIFTGTPDVRKFIVAPARRYLSGVVNLP